MKDGGDVVRVLFVLMLIFGDVASAGITSDDECHLSSVESQLAEWLVTHAEQQRESLVCDPELHAFAGARAQDMADRNYFGHVTPDRKGPDELLRDTGYEIPKYYVGGISNSIESILAGEDEPRKAWQLFLDSTTHRNHLLGVGEIYGRQQRFGIAYLHQPDSHYAHYWVIVIAEHGSADQPMTCTPSPPVCMIH